MPARFSGETSTYGPSRPTQANASPCTSAKITEIDDFRPWIRLWAPDGSSLGNTSGLTEADIGAVVAPVTGTYVVLVASFDSGFDGTGTYSLTATLGP